MKDIVVTGGNAGIGFDTVRELARRGHRITFTSRNTEKGQTAQDRIRNEYPEADVSVVQVDLTDFESIRQACSEILKMSPRIDGSAAESRRPAEGDPRRPSSRPRPVVPIARMEPGASRTRTPPQSAVASRRETTFGPDPRCAWLS